MKWHFLRKKEHRPEKILILLRKKKTMNIC